MNMRLNDMDEKEVKIELDIELAFGKIVNEIERAVMKTFREDILPGLKEGEEGEVAAKWINYCMERAKADFIKRMGE